MMFLHLPSFVWIAASAVALVFFMLLGSVVMIATRGEAGYQANLLPLGGTSRSGAGSTRSKRSR